MNANYANGAYTRKTAALTAGSIVEIKITGDNGEPVAVYPQVSLTSSEVSPGRVNYGGRLVCTVVFADGETLCRVQKGAEFSHHADNDLLAPAQSCTVALECASHTVRREGSSCVVSVVINAKIDVYDRAERNYITDIEGAVARREEGKLFDLITFSGESEADDDFSLVATDVLVPSAKALVLDCSVNTGAAEISGEICLSLLAVREGSPVALDRVIPFKATIACEQAVMPARGYCRAEIKDMSLNCKVNEDRGKCDVVFNATLAFWGGFYTEEPATFVTDAFSTQNELAIEFGGEQAAVCTDIKVYSQRVFGPCVCKAKLNYTCAFLAAALPAAEYSRTETGIEGSVRATLLYLQGEEIHSAEVDMPFAVELTGLGLAACPVDVAVSGVSIRQRAEGECEGEAQLKIVAADGLEYRVQYATGVTEGPQKQLSQSAISVYVPACGDGLWETAKKLNSPPESIKSANPGLTYPLTGKERILIFRGKN